MARSQVTGYTQQAVRSLQELHVAYQSVVEHVSRNGKFWHDIYHLVLLPPILTMSSMYLAGMDELLEPYVWAFVTYTAVDITMLYLLRNAMKRVPLLITHHVLILLLAPIVLAYDSIQFISVLATVVELNTLTLIMRRNCMRGSLLHKFCSGLFLVTWFGVRCGLFPYIAYFFTDLWLAEWASSAE